jgi:hypothetical protein
MLTWKNFDILGRSLILLAIGVQFLILSPLESLNARGDVYYLLENQYFIAGLVKLDLDKSKDINAIYEFEKATGGIKLSSTRDKSRPIGQFEFVNKIFVGIFLLGSVILLFARHREIRDI